MSEKNNVVRINNNNIKLNLEQLTNDEVLNNLEYALLRVENAQAEVNLFFELAKERNILEDWAPNEEEAL